MVKERQGITGSNCLKSVSGKVIVDEKGIKGSWKEYMEKLINEENKQDHRISATVKEGPADCIRIDEVAAALKNMRRQSHRLVRASIRNDTVSEMIQSTGDTGTQQILALCNGGCFSEDWKRWQCQL